MCVCVQTGLSDVQATVGKGELPVIAESEDDWCVRLS